MSITAEYMPSVLNPLVDRASTEKPDSSGWILHPNVFQEVCQLLCSLTTDLSVTCLCHQVPRHIACHPDTQSPWRSSMVLTWNMGLPYAFPSFNMILREFVKVKRECVPTLILIAPNWSIHPWYSGLLNLSVKELVLLPQVKFF